MPQIDPSAATMYDPLLGTVLAGRYRVLARLGEGGMGAVYRAEHIFMKKIVALKVLHPELGRVEEIAKRFEREAQAASRLTHEGIVQVADFGQAESGALYLVMEYAAGESLASVLDRSPRLPVEKAVSLMRLILDALAHAHAEGIVHRDLKPENIMVLRPGDGRKGDAIKLLDFGIAKILDGDAAGPALTQAGMVFGTPTYMSPEQASGRNVDERADLYACGVMLYQMMAGRLPFVDNDPVKLLMMQVAAPPPPVADVAPDAQIPPALAAVVMRLLAKDPKARFPSATALRDAIETAVGAPATESRIRPPQTWLPLRAALARGWRSLPERHRKLTPLACGVVAGMLLAFIIFGGAKDGAKPDALEPEPGPALEAIEQSLARGQLVEVRAGLMQQLSKQPGSARVHYLLGQLESVEGRPQEALAHYRAPARSRIPQ